MTTTERAATPDLTVLERRPPPGTPRDYRFPPFTRERLANGMTVIQAQLPGRPLLSAQLVIDAGAGTEPPELTGVSNLTARALTEGTERRTAVEFIEASERLGADLHAEAGWESLAGSLDVPRSRFGPALGLLAEMLLEPSFPDIEIDRLRAERINDLLQARAEPRRRVERVFAETVYSPESPYSRPLGGTEETVPGLTRDAVVERHRSLLDPEHATLVVAGDLRDVPVVDLVEEHFGGWQRQVRDGDLRRPLVDAPHPAGGRVVLVDRPGSPQSEIRAGHVGLRRRIDDFHAVTVLASILGGLFNSRLNRLLREERGYTYGVAAGFEFRRAAGPFAVRTAVQTEVTGPAVEDMLAELRRIREAPVESTELEEARNYLVGVFPLRFEAPPQVVAALAGLVLFGLPDDELDRYRPAIAAVSPDDVLAASRHVRPDEASIVVVGDADRVEPALARLGVGDVTVLRDPETPSPEDVQEVVAEAGRS